jgi:peptidoglycan/LPS O-acetylase OafA/YrhL
VAFLAWRLRDRPIGAVSLAIAFLTAVNLVFASFAGFNLTNATFQWGALRIVPSFLYGSALYLAWRSGAVAKPGVALTGAGIALLTVVFSTSFGQSDILTVIALGLLVLSISGLGQDGKGIMSGKTLVYLGEISFATYMIYVPWKWVYLKAVNGLLGTDHAALPFVWWFAGLLALVPLSMLAHHLVERPFRKIVRYYGEHLHGAITYSWVKQGLLLREMGEKVFEH